MERLPRGAARARRRPRSRRRSRCRRRRRTSGRRAGPVLTARRPPGAQALEQDAGGLDRVVGQPERAGEDVGRAGRARCPAPARRSCTPSVSRPLTTSLTVPSPPRATTTSVPSRIARQASAAACPRLAVSATVELGRRGRGREASTSRSRAVMAVARGFATTSTRTPAPYAVGTLALARGGVRTRDRRLPAPRSGAGRRARSSALEALALVGLGGCPRRQDPGRPAAGQPAPGRCSARRWRCSAPRCFALGARGLLRLRPGGAHARRRPGAARAAGRLQPGLPGRPASATAGRSSSLAAGGALPAVHPAGARRARPRPRRAGRRAAPAPAPARSLRRLGRASPARSRLRPRATSRDTCICDTPTIAGDLGLGLVRDEAQQQDLALGLGQLLDHRRAATPAARPARSRSSTIAEHRVLGHRSRRASASDVQRHAGVRAGGVQRLDAPRPGRRRCAPTSSAHRRRAAQLLATARQRGVAASSAAPARAAARGPASRCRGSAA